MQKGLLEQYFEINMKKKALEKELKLIKEQITAELEKKEKCTAKQGEFRAVYEEIQKRILDHDALKQELGIKKFEAMKKDAPYMKLTVVKEA